MMVINEIKVKVSELCQSYSMAVCSGIFIHS